MLDLLFTILGILGVFLIWLAIVSEVKNKLYKDHHIFILLNMMGTFLLSVNAFYFEVWIFFILNFFLFLTNLYYFYKVYFVVGISNKK